MKAAGPARGALSPALPQRRCSAEARGAEPPSPHGGGRERGAATAPLYRRGAEKASSLRDGGDRNLGGPARPLPVPHGSDRYLTAPHGTSGRVPVPRGPSRLGPVAQGVLWP